MPNLFRTLCQSSSYVWGLPLSFGLSEQIREDAMPRRNGRSVSHGEKRRIDIRRTRLRLANRDDSGYVKRDLKGKTKKIAMRLLFADKHKGS